MHNRPPFERSGDNALVAGVASGLAHHLGVDPLVVRLGFAGLTVAGGIGVVLYGAFWALVPQAADQRRPNRAERIQLPAIAALVVGGVLLVHQSGLFRADPGLWPVLVVGAGIALVWRQADESRRARWLGQRGTPGAVRVLAGVVLLIAGLLAFFAGNVEVGAARKAIVAIGVVVAGLALTFAPWWWRLVEDLGAERRERIRSQERAELAAHLHDSVLQTLALIQRQAGSPSDVQRLARSQERELRTWLYTRTELADSGRFVGAVTAAAAEVEDHYGVPVEVVTVGDCPLDEQLGAVVRAAKEAMVNAAKFAGVDHVSVFLEVDDEEATVFVRDTGVGFDPSAAPFDRRGLAESIVGRMERHGGVAVVRSAPGEGTEIELRLTRMSV